MSSLGVPTFAVLSVNFNDNVDNRTFTAPCLPALLNENGTVPVRSPRSLLPVELG